MCWQPLHGAQAGDGGLTRQGGAPSCKVDARQADCMQAHTMQTLHRSGALGASRGPVLGPAVSAVASTSECWLEMVVGCDLKTVDRAVKSPHALLTDVWTSGLRGIWEHQARARPFHFPGA